VCSRGTARQHGANPRGLVGGQRRGLINQALDGGAGRVGQVAVLGEPGNGLVAVVDIPALI